MKKKVFLFVSIVIVVCTCGYFLWSYLSYEKFDGSFNIGTTDYIKSYSDGEYVNVYVDYETYAQIKIKKVSFKLRYSDGLKLVKNEIVKGSQITDYEVNKNKYTIKLNGNSILTDSLGFQFVVSDETKKLYVELYDISLIDKDGIEYKVGNKKTLLYEDGTFYKCTDSGYYGLINGKDAVIYTKFDYAEYKFMDCEKVKVNIDKSYIPVRNFWHDSKMLFYKNDKYYLYDFKEEKFVLETEKVFKVDSNPLFVTSYIDKNGEDTNAYGVVTDAGQIYINLDKNEAYYGFNKDYELRDASFITIGDDAHFESIKTDGKLIKVRKKDASFEAFGLFNGDDYSLMNDSYSSCEFNNYDNILCYKEYYDRRDEAFKASLFDNKGKLLYDSDDLYSYFDNIDREHIIYKLSESNDKKLNIVDYAKKVTGTVIYDGEVYQDLFVSYINDESVNSCYTYFGVNDKPSNYITIISQKAKVYKKDNYNQFKYFKDLEYCDDNS